jgi:hypothetical protein
LQGLLGKLCLLPLNEFFCLTWRLFHHVSVGFIAWAC